MSVVTEADVIARLPSLLEEAKQSAVIISDGESDLGALISMEDFAIVHRAKEEKFLRAMREFGDDIRARASEHGLSPDDLMKILDRKAS